ncbi:MAG: molybdopterin molybdotransferase MoeA [Chloroflexi bacterium]|nr:molybdopterin molybdotransferase MoeA [Chloroflexota bacterium]
MFSVSEARERILSQFHPLPSEILPLDACAARILAQDILAPHELPLFDNSSMDGFAIRSADAPGDPGSRSTLRVVADIPAGTSPTTKIKKGEAARIMTGAQMPEGADAVIPVEDTDFHSRTAGTQAPGEISFTKQVRSGDNVRVRGMDLGAGEVILHKGRRIRSQDLGLMAMLGLSRVTVHKRPRVALISSGDELLEVGAALEDGKIRDSNTYALMAMIDSAGADGIRMGIARDTFESVASLFERAVGEGVDLILSSAGVSVGAFDYIREVVEARGRIEFWKVNMRPGKPLAFGVYRGINMIGLPGNPVSAFVGFEVFVRAVLEKLAGRLDGGHSRVRVRCSEPVESDGRESYLRARIQLKDDRLTAQLTGHQGSGNLLSLVQADALLIIPAGVKCVPAGQEVEAILL